MPGSSHPSGGDRIALRADDRNVASPVRFQERSFRFPHKRKDRRVNAFTFSTEGISRAPSSRSALAAPDLWIGSRRRRCRPHRGRNLERYRKHQDRTFLVHRYVDESVIGGLQRHRHRSIRRRRYVQHDWPEGHGAVSGWHDHLEYREEPQSQEEESRMRAGEVLIWSVHDLRRNRCVQGNQRVWQFNRQHHLRRAHNRRELLNHTRRGPGADRGRRPNIPTLRGPA